MALGIRKIRHNVKETARGLINVMQRCRRLCTTFERNWRDRNLFLNDRQGRFNLGEVAAELQLNETYLASLYKPLHYTYCVKGQLYPAERGRSSRPGSLASSRNRMFPLYRRDYGLDREMRHLNRRRVTTEVFTGKGSRLIHSTGFIYTPHQAGVMMRWAVDITGIDIEADLRHEASKRVPQEPSGPQKARWLALDEQKLISGNHTGILGSVWVPNQDELQKLYDARISHPKQLENPFGMNQQQLLHGSMSKMRNESSNSANSNNMQLSQYGNTQSFDNSLKAFKGKEVCIFSTFLDPQGKRKAVTIVMNQPVFKGVDVVNVFLKNYVSVDRCLSQRFSTNPRLYKLFFADELTGEEDMAVQLDLSAQNFSCYFVNPLPAAKLYLFPQRTGLLPSTPYDIHLTVQIRPLDQQGKPIERKCLVPADMLAEKLETTLSSRLLSSTIVQGSLRIKYGPLELNINEYYDFGPGCGRPSCPIAERTILSLYRFGVTEVVVSGRAVEDVAVDGLVESTDDIVIDMDINEAFSFQQFEVIRINRYGARQQWLLCVDGERLYTVKPSSDSVKTVERPIKDIEEVRVFSSRPRYMEVIYTRASRLEEDHFECSTASNCVLLNEKLSIIRHELHKKQEKEIQAATAKERNSVIYRLLDGFKTKWLTFWGIV